MNGTPRPTLRHARALRAALLTLGLFSLSTVFASACGDSDEGQTPVCPDGASDDEKCFTSPGAAATQLQTGGGGTDGGGGEGGSGGGAGDGGSGG